MTHRYVARPNELSFLINNMNQPVIKVISGVRRSGKSTLLLLFQDYLIEQGVMPEQIISVNFDDFHFHDLLNPYELHQYLLKRIRSNQMNYLFLDEIHLVPDFEKLLDSLLYREDTDIYIVGSNEYFIKKLANSPLEGKYICHNMLPLSFKSYQNWHKLHKHFATQQHLFNRYCQNSFPFTLFFDTDFERVHYLEGIYSTVVLNDIVKRLQVQDVRVLERLIEALVSSIGNLVTINKLKNKLKQLNTPIANNTIDRYITGILESNIMYRARRFDIPSMKILSTQEKYYMVDPGLQYLVLNGQVDNIQSIIENVVYLELLRRGFEVYIGKSNQYMVDFVAIDADYEYTYYQVVESTLDDKVLKGELKCLQSIHDYYPKYLITLDDVPQKTSYGGIKKMNLLDWLVNDD